MEKKLLLWILHQLLTMFLLYYTHMDCFTSILTIILSHKLMAYLAGQLLQYTFDSVSSSSSSSRSPVWFYVIHVLLFDTSLYTGKYKCFLFTTNRYLHLYSISTISPFRKSMINQTSKNALILLNKTIQKHNFYWDTLIILDYFCEKKISTSGYGFCILWTCRQYFINFNTSTIINSKSI